MAVIGFIGTGNMGGALARAAAKSPLTERLLLANRTREKAARLAEALGAEVCDNAAAAREADVLFLAVKPQGLEAMVEGIRSELAARGRVLIVSMAAGWTVAELAALLGAHPVVRIMPNIPVAVGGGVTMLCASENVTEEEKALVKELLAASGMVSELSEPLMEAASGVTGCGPAFAAMFVDALADGAVACGLPRREAIAYAAQMMKGTAELLLTHGEHPDALRDRVCSPGGSTIQGVRKLEEGAFRAAVMNAVIATWEKEF
ncbi:MAG: pyrroline-5-carboxylate reductase [Oscillospiraceae bacterium]|nr:pyrroline-5-carboxylate reductase [Oscillospiraceae bacterium]